jgi:hypothetical protein
VSSPQLNTELNSIEEIMRRLGVGRNTVYELITPGKPDEEDGEPTPPRLRSVKVGRRRLVTEQALRDFIAALDQAGD